ncbi:YMGG-like glycine zipper-containing protein [Zoogloea sp. LCSB751]|uniref:YMGG-like glycine zipper-containing protein n=1 Tax=Zoogloea sp. LCSB751 TaxID=1965277 RepID=UPI0009A548B7|nr:YMGG-like glycine zipper-containing protein [Zoogloea sp. LCSB751]
MKAPYALLPLILLSACASLPSGPRVAVMPTPGKPFDLFVAEDRQCRAFAEQAIGIAPQDLATQNMINNAAVGTAVGAAVGALGGGHNGAATGAAIGMVAGTASGASQATYAGADAQRRYDIAYQQCMYAKGNQLPGYGYRQAPASPPPYYYPPPPPPR